MYMYMYIEPHVHVVNDMYMYIVHVVNDMYIVHVVNDMYITCISYMWSMYMYIVRLVNVHVYRTCGQCTCIHYVIHYVNRFLRPLLMNLVEL